MIFTFNVALVVDVHEMSKSLDLRLLLKLYSRT